MIMDFNIQISKNPSDALLINVLKMHNQYFDSSKWSPIYLAKFFDIKDQYPILAFANDINENILGYVIGRLNKKENEFLIYSLLVLENARGKGIGKMLLKEIINHVLKYIKADVISITFRKKNSVNNLYSSVGFDHQCKIGYYKNGDEKNKMFIVINKDEFRKSNSNQK